MYNVTTLRKILSTLATVLLVGSILLLLLREETENGVEVESVSQGTKSIKTEQLLLLLSELALLPPETPVNKTCLPPPVRSHISYRRHLVKKS